MDRTAAHTPVAFEWKSSEKTIEIPVDITVAPECMVSAARAARRSVPGKIFEFFLKPSQIYPNINYDRCGDSCTARYVKAIPLFIDNLFRDIELF
jgi:hypothetical protein